MSTVSLPGLISAAPEPVVGVASKKSAVDPASSNSFGTALNKALPPKPEAKKPEASDKGLAPEPGKGVAESPIQEPTPPLDAETPVKADDSKPLTEPVKPDAPALGDETDAAPEVDGPVVAVDPVAPLPQALTEGLVANQPPQVPGLTSSENAKDFKPADNTVGSSVLASIQMSRKMESQKGGLIPQSTDAPKDIAAVAAEVKQGLHGKDQAPAAPVNPFGTNAKADVKTAPQPAPAVAPTVEPATQSTSAPVPQIPAGSDHKATSAPADLNTPGIPTAAHVTGQSQTQALNQPTGPALTAQVATQEWNKGFGQQVVNMHLRGDQTMELNLHPQDLGPISITLKVSDASQAHAQFFSHNAQVRSAIEQALPQLKEAMAEQGISLGQTSVGDQRQQQSFRDTESQAVSSREISESLNLVDVSSEKPPSNQQVDGQISTYA